MVSYFFRQHCGDCVRSSDQQIPACMEPWVVQNLLGPCLEPNLCCCCDPHCPGVPGLSATQLTLGATFRVALPAHDSASVACRSPVLQSGSLKTPRVRAEPCSSSPCCPRASCQSSQCGGDGNLSPGGEVSCTITSTAPHADTTHVCRRNPLPKINRLGREVEKLMRLAAGLVSKVETGSCILCVGCLPVLCPGKWQVWEAGPLPFRACSQRALVWAPYLPLTLPFLFLQLASALLEKEVINYEDIEALIAHRLHGPRKGSRRRSGVMPRERSRIRGGGGA